MDLDRERIYFNAVLGGLGGLLGWAWVAWLHAPLAGAPVYLRDVVFGLGVGAATGGALGGADGLVAARSWRRWLSGLRVGAALGAVGGALGLVVGELAFGLAGGGTWPRALGWALLGVSVGAGEGLVRRAPSLVRHGALGGLLGGVVGGSTYECLNAVLLSATGDRGLGLAWGGAVGLVVLGACIGAAVGLVESLLRRAWLTFLGGPLEGQHRTLDPARPRTTLGRSDACAIIVPGDSSVAAVHAEICAENGGLVLRACGGPVAVESDGVVAAPAAHALRSGDRIRLGATPLVFCSGEGQS